MFEAKFQTFDDPPETAATAPRLSALRTELQRRGLTGFIVPRADRSSTRWVREGLYKFSFELRKYALIPF